MKREDLPDIIIVGLIVALFVLFWAADNPREEPPLTEAEWAEDVIQNTEYVNEGPADWRQNIPIVGPTSTSTDHLR